MVYGPSIQELLQIALQGLSANDEEVDSLVPLNSQYVLPTFFDERRAMRQKRMRVNMLGALFLVVGNLIIHCQLS